MRRTILFVFLLLSVSLTLLAQDDTNLLVNPGFEQPYADLATSEDRQRIVAEGWTPWDVTAAEIQPEYAAASAVRPERVISEADSQTYIAFLAAPTGGLYQTVTGVMPGEVVTFGVSAYVWSSQDDLNVDESIDPGGVTVQVGIDPAGGVDPESNAVIWSEGEEVYDTLTQYLVSTEAQADTVTVFIRVVIAEEVLITEVYFDDASLTVGGEAPTGDATDEFNPEVTADATVEPTEEASPEPIDEPTDEAAIPTEEASPEPTSGIIEFPTAEPVVTDDLTATAVMQVTVTALISDVTGTAFALTQTAPAADDPIFGTATALVSEATGTVVALTMVADVANQGPDATATAGASTQAANNNAIFGTATALIEQVTATAGAVNATNTAVADANGTTAVQITQTLEQSLISANETGTAQAQPTDATVVEATDVPATEIVETQEPDVELPTVFVLPTLPPTEEGEDTDPEATDEEVVPVSETFPGQILHTVQYGDTVADLAVRYDSTIEVIIEANGLDDNALIYVGQGLVIPVRILPATSTPTATPVVIVVTATLEGSGEGGEPAAGDGTYIIRPGDTLSTIARRYNTTVRTLAELNGIVNVNSIQAGQRLIVPTGAAPTPVPPEVSVTPEPEPTSEAEPTTYRIQPGDTLYTIAIRNGVTVRELAELNQISNANLIYVGQVLQLP